MNKKMAIQIFIIVLSFSMLIVLIRQNVTAQKEPINDPNKSTSSIQLEINSELVKNVYSKLSLMNDDVFKDENYRYLYFNFDEKKILSNDEKLYIIFDSIYKNDKFENNKENSIETLKVSVNTVKDEAVKLFKDIDFDPINITYKPSTTCGIVDYLFTGQEYVLKFKKCIDDENIDKVKIEKATKEGNYIKLKVKVFHAIKEPKNKKTKETFYLVKNFNSEETLAKMTLGEINDILDIKGLDEYLFSFELKGDDYYIDNITKVKENV